MSDCNSPNIFFMLWKNYIVELKCLFSDYIYHNRVRWILKIIKNGVGGWSRVREHWGEYCQVS